MGVEVYWNTVSRGGMEYTYVRGVLLWCQIMDIQIRRFSKNRKANNAQVDLVHFCAKLYQKENVLNNQSGQL